MNATDCTIQSTLTDLARRDDLGQLWKPLLFPLDDALARAALGELLAGGRPLFVHDTLRAQLLELLETREAAVDFGPGQLEERLHRYLGGRDLATLGVWIYYPWSRRLVRVLAEADYRELRTSRNRNKITAAEQERLRGLKLGIVGLSVGSATTITLVMEEIGGEYLLADFDRLSLSNMNRLRAGVHQIDVNKAVMTAREIFEINPYARVQVFPAGLDGSNMERFLDGGDSPGKLDMLFEECDDLFVKVRLRELARARRLPVLMETSDRGLFDIERFDREPERPLFHGLVDVAAESLRGLDTFDKVPTVLKILGGHAMSTRFAASLVEIKASVRTWPQLASGISLGAAINVDAARRIALGTFNQSGRFYVDLERLVADGAAADLSHQLVPEASGPAPEPGALPTLARRALPLSRDDVRALVAHAALAPSGGNCQPWRFVFAGGRLRCLHDVERSASYLDYDNLASYFAFGALLENLELTAQQMGIATEVALFPDPSDRLVVCDVGFKESGRSGKDPLFAQIARRATNRRLSQRAPLVAQDADALVRAVASRDARLQLISDLERLEILGQVLGRGDRVRLLHRVTHDEMMNELRWTSEQASVTRDGLDVRTLELSPADLAGMRIASAWPIMEMVGQVGGGHGLEKLAKKSIAAASAVGLVTVAGNRPEDYLRGGRAVQRSWLTATERGLAFQPMTAINYLWARLRDGGRDMPGWVVDELSDLRATFCQLFDVSAADRDVMLFRLSRADTPTARSLRRRVDDMLRFE